MVVLRDFTILASNKALQFPEAFEPLFERPLLVFWGATIYPVNVFAFVQVKLGSPFAHSSRVFLLDWYQVSPALKDLISTSWPLVGPCSLGGITDLTLNF